MLIQRSTWPDLLLMPDITGGKSHFYCQSFDRIALITGILGLLQRISSSLMSSIFVCRHLASS